MRIGFRVLLALVLSVPLCAAWLAPQFHASEAVLAQSAQCELIVNGGFDEGLLSWGTYGGVTLASGGALVPPGGNLSQTPPIADYLAGVEGSLTFTASASIGVASMTVYYMTVSSHFDLSTTPQNYAIPISIEQTGPLGFFMFVSDPSSFSAVILDDVSLLVPCEDPTPTPLPTETAIPTPLPTASPTPTATSLPTETPTPTATAAPLPTETSTPTATATPLSTDTPTPTAMATTTPQPTETPTPSLTATPTPTPTASPTETRTATPTPLPMSTATPAPSPTNTPTPTATPGEGTVVVVLTTVDGEQVPVSTTVCVGSICHQGDEFSSSAASGTLFTFVVPAGTYPLTVQNDSPYQEIASNVTVGAGETITVPLVLQIKPTPTPGPTMTAPGPTSAPGPIGPTPTSTVNHLPNTGAGDDNSSGMSMMALLGGLMMLGIMLLAAALRPKSIEH